MDCPLFKEVAVDRSVAHCVVDEEGNRSGLRPRINKEMSVDRGVAPTRSEGSKRYTLYARTCNLHPKAV